MVYWIVLAIVVGVLLYLLNNKMAESILNTPPQNSPASYISKPLNTKKVIVNIGDSITHGVVSQNYSQMIDHEMSGRGYEIVNAGINSDLAYSVVQRIDEIVACRPAVATILIGTNDVISTFGGRIKSYWKFKRLPKNQNTSLTFYVDSVSKIIQELKKVPGVKIFIYSLPVLGEDLGSPYNEKVKAYSDAIRGLSVREGLIYLPLNEAMREHLTSSPSIGALEFGNERIATVLGLIKHKLLGHSWNRISTSNKLQLTTDTVHLNELGAKMVADLAINQLVE